MKHGSDSPTEAPLMPVGGLSKKGSRRKLVARKMSWCGDAAAASFHAELRPRRFRRERTACPAGTVVAQQANPLPKGPKGIRPMRWTGKKANQSELTHGYAGEKNAGNEG